MGSELIIPLSKSHIEYKNEILEDEITNQDIETSLGKLKVLDEYDPLDYQCDLNKSLQQKYKIASKKTSASKSSVSKTTNRSKEDSVKRANSKMTKYSPVI